MKKKLSIVLIIILIIAGLSFLLYPFISNEWNSYRQNKLVTTYDRKVAQKEKNVGIDYISEWQNAETYNEQLVPVTLKDSFSFSSEKDEPGEDYMACLNLNGDGMMGYVEIPKIDIEIPIYHTVNEEVLQNAAGHLEGSSLPVGGESTHAVISAHRGLPNATLFTDLDQLAEGDHFLIRVLDDTLCYEVDQILTVEPTDIEALRIEDGKDYVTLFTCTPYGVNSHRLLVRGHRVEYVEEVVVDEYVPMATTSVHTNYLMWTLGGIVIVVVFILILAQREKNLRKRIAERDRVIDIIENDKKNSEKE